MVFAAVRNTPVQDSLLLICVVPAVEQTVARAVRRGYGVEEEEPAQPSRECLPPVEGVKVTAREGVLPADPRGHVGRRSVLEPPVWVRHDRAMEDLLDALGAVHTTGTGWGGTMVSPSRAGASSGAQYPTRSRYRAERASSSSWVPIRVAVPSINRMRRRRRPGHTRSGNTSPVPPL